MYQSKETLPLRYVSQLSFREIGQTPGIPDSTAKTYFHRARKPLCALLEPEFADDRNAAREQRKAGRTMEIRTDQERDHARLKPTREIGRIIVTIGRVVYMLMDGTNKSELFAAYVEKDAYYIELVPPEDASKKRL